MWTDGRLVEQSSVGVWFLFDRVVMDGAFVAQEELEGLRRDIEAQEAMIQGYQEENRKAHARIKELEAHLRAYETPGGAGPGSSPAKTGESPEKGQRLREMLRLQVSVRRRPLARRHVGRRLPGNRALQCAGQRKDQQCSAEQCDPIVHCIAKGPSRHRSVSN